MTEATPPVDTTDTGASATPAPAAAAAPSVETIPNPNPEPSTAATAPTEGETPATTTPTPEPVEYKLPDEWKDKPWASKIKSEADLYKQLDNLNTAVGKKIVVPDLATATDTEREEYFKLTRPANGVEAYQFGDTVDPALKAGMGDSLLKNGVPEYVANNIIKDYQAYESQVLAEQYNPETIKETMTAAFGDKWESITGATKNALTKIMGPEDNQLMDNLPNTYISLIYKTFGNVLKAVETVRAEYGIKESAAHILAGTAPAQPTDINAIRANATAELAKLMTRPHTQAERQKWIDIRNETYKNDPRIVRKA
jgi:hypothetical protein